jgi:hypothetical protein
MPEEEKQQGARDSFFHAGMIEINNIGRDEFPQGSRIKVMGQPATRTPFYILHSWDEERGLWMAYPDSNNRRKLVKRIAANQARRHGSK